MVTTLAERQDLLLRTVQEKVLGLGAAALGWLLGKLFSAFGALP